MESFFYWTAWEMEKPAAYGPFHIIATWVLLTVTVLAAWLLRNTNEKQNRIVLGTVGGFLLLTEMSPIPEIPAALSLPPAAMSHPQIFSPISRT